MRLRILDLEHGAQPMRSDDGDSVIVFNGEIYNNTELREELLSRGHILKSYCDTETALHAFLEWDTDCFARLRGMFAVALWNQSERRLVLARDRMGIKPLYIHRRGSDLYFGSELKALLVHPEIPRVLNERALHDYLSLNYVPGPHTLVKDIDKLPPATWLEWRNGKIRTESYWQLEMRPDPTLDVESAKAQLDQLLRQSVREHMVADVPLGVWASGGLDSTAVLHYASEISASPLKTFSVSFKGRSFDESVYFQEVARRYNTDHHELDLNPDLDLAGAIEEMAFHSDEPGADAGAVPVWFLSQMTRKHVTVALSGEGADELFGGYQTYLADHYARLLRHVPQAARRFAKQVAGYLPVSDDKISLEYKINRMLSGSLLSPAEAHLFWNGTFSEAEKKRLHIRNGFPATSRLIQTLPGGGRQAGELNRYLWLDQRYYLPDDILYKCDRMSMAHSIEVRPPFLDHRIVEFAATLPESFKIRGGKLKFLLREVLRDKLPACVLDRPKQGFDIPAHHWFRTSLRELLLDHVDRRTVKETGLFHWDAIQELLDRHLTRRANLGYHLWGLLVLFLWMKRWGIQTATPAEETREVFSIVSVTN